jgi:hypothetical protein
VGLSELMLVDQEVTAEEKRLDILASGTDGDQDAIAVIIENQYGATDHRHLGQIITYLAQQQHGLAIWIAEDFSQAHLAAVDFLNRTSIEGVGYLLVRVRFTHALEEYQVHFEVLSRPNAFLKSSTRTSVRKSNPDVVEFVAPVWESLKEPLKQGGLLIAGQVEDGAVVLGEDGFGVWVLMLGVQGFGWGGRLEGQAVVSLTACRAEDSSTMPVLAA